ncbi:MAG: hypothetical protein R8L53_06090, partial [Mariprofundales bacterium]
MKTKKSWQKPTITPHRMGALNKFGNSSNNKCSEHFDNVALAPLLAEYGSPLFVISEQVLRNTVRKLLRAFETRYNDVVYSWSYKTNYLAAVCNTLHQEGAWAEVVSTFEYEKAR